MFSSRTGNWEKPADQAFSRVCPAAKSTTPARVQDFAEYMKVEGVYFNVQYPEFARRLGNGGHESGNL